MATQTINISLDTELLKLVDKAAKSEFASRSDYIRQALVGKLKTEEERDWEELLDISAELEENARRMGIVTDEDVALLVKESRQERLAKQAN